MSAEILQVIIATYPDEETPDQKLEWLKQATKEGQVDIVDAAVIKKDPDGTIHVKDTANVSTGKGAAIGGVIGGVVGLLAGPAGVVLLGSAGAVIGGAITGGDEGIPDERLQQVGEELEPGTSAVVAVVEPVWIKDVNTELANAASNVTIREVKPEVAALLLGSTGGESTENENEG